MILRNHLDPFPRAHCPIHAKPVVSRWLWRCAAAVAIALLVAGIWVEASRTGEIRIFSEQQVMAVLPFELVNDAPEQMRWEWD